MSSINFYAYFTYGRFVCKPHTTIGWFQRFFVLPDTGHCMFHKPVAGQSQYFGCLFFYREVDCIIMQCSQQKLFKSNMTEYWIKLAPNYFSFTDTSYTTYPRGGGSCLVPALSFVTKLGKWLA